MAERLDDILHADDLIGVLARDIDVRLLNVSASGCLVESQYRLESGTAATLRLQMDDEEYCDDVLVTRCHEVQGAGSTFHLGVEFLWTTPPGSRSLRRVATRLQQHAGRGGVKLEFEARRPM
jgi:hypothetical protein